MKERLKWCRPRDVSQSIVEPLNQKQNETSHRYMPLFWKHKITRSIYRVRQDILPISSPHKIVRRWDIEISFVAPLLSQIHVFLTGVSNRSSTAFSLREKKDFKRLQNKMSVFQILDFYRKKRLEFFPRVPNPINNVHFSFSIFIYRSGKRILGTKLAPQRESRSSYDLMRVWKWGEYPAVSCTSECGSHKSP